MFSTLIQAFLPQAKQSTQRVSEGPTVIAPADFALVGGGCPKGGWLDAGGSGDCPKGGWLDANA